MLRNVDQENLFIAECYAHQALHTQHILPDDATLAHGRDSLTEKIWPLLFVHLGICLHFYSNFQRKLYIVVLSLASERLEIKLYYGLYLAKT